MNDLIMTLKHCILFKNLPFEDISSILKSTDYKILPFSKGTPVAIEGENCLDIGIVTTGSVEVQKLFASGKTITIDRLKSGDIFGQVIIFSKVNKFPSTIISSEQTEIMFISKDDIIRLCSANTVILNSFMGLLSDRIVMLNNKIRDLSYQSIKQKISNYIIDEYSRQKSLILALPSSRKEMADELGIPRPSLSRELISMKNQGLIAYNKNIIEIKNLAALEDLLLE